MENTLLVPIDFSKHALSVVQQSLILAKSSGLSLTLMTVLKTGEGWLWDDSEEEVRNYSLKIEHRLRTLAKDLQEESGVEIFTMIRKGKVVEEVLRIADYLNPICIVIGGSSSNSFTRKIIGSKALELIKMSSHPVISIKENVWAEKYENILLPIDATKRTDQKVDVAIRMAKLFGSKISILTAIDKYRPESIVEINKKLKLVEDNIREAGVECTSGYVETEGDLHIKASSILEYAHGVEADLMIIMTQQEKSITQFFLGTLAQHLIFTSDIPILTMNPKE